MPGALADPRMAGNLFWLSCSPPLRLALAAEEFERSLVVDQRFESNPGVGWAIPAGSRQQQSTDK